MYIGRICYIGIADSIIMCKQTIKVTIYKMDQVFEQNVLQLSQQLGWNAHFSKTTYRGEWRIIQVNIDCAITACALPNGALMCLPQVLNP